MNAQRMRGPSMPRSAGPESSSDAILARSTGSRAPSPGAHAARADGNVSRPPTIRRSVPVEVAQDVRRPWPPPAPGATGSPSCSGLCTTTNRRATPAAPAPAAGRRRRRRWPRTPSTTIWSRPGRDGEALPGYTSKASITGPGRRPGTRRGPPRSTTGAAFASSGRSGRKMLRSSSTARRPGRSCRPGSPSGPDPRGGDAPDRVLVVVAGPVVAERDAAGSGRPDQWGGRNEPAAHRCRRPTPSTRSRVSGWPGRRTRLRTQACWCRPARSRRARPWRRPSRATSASRSARRRARDTARA